MASAYIVTRKTSTGLLSAIASAAVPGPYSTAARS
jgi:hypothetical protein